MCAIWSIFIIAIRGHAAARRHEKRRGAGPQSSHQLEATRTKMTMRWDPHVPRCGSTFPGWSHLYLLSFFCICFHSGRSCFGSSPKQSLIINCCHICHYWSCFALHAPSLKKEIAILDTHTLVLCSFHHKML